MNEPIQLDLDDWVRLRWWAIARWFHRCPECGQRGHSRHTPRWDKDRIARALGGVTPDRCGCCGKKVDR